MLQNVQAKRVDLEIKSEGDIQRKRDQISNLKIEKKEGEMKWKNEEMNARRM